jgi:demethylmenaquinone methyltransferase/2-methoxy-6-polyprenyl-1,4-benzoquinol methylase
MDAVHPQERHMNESSMQDYYAARAPEYDRVYAKPERQPDLRAIEQWLPTVFTGRSVLEVACGTGYWTQFIAPAARSILAVDAAEETLAIARTRVRTGEVKFVVGDAYALPAARREFEGAFAGFWLSHVPRSRVRAFLEGLDACLAPGAQVVLLDNLYVEGSSTPIAETDEQGTWQVRPLSDGSTHRVLKNFPSEAQLTESVAGLASEVRYRTWQYFWAFEYTVR